MATVAPDAVRLFNEWKIGKTDHGFLVFRLQSAGSIGVDQTGPKGLSWEETVAQLNPTEACWMACHFKYTTSEGAPRGKTVLIQWIPSESPRKQKMQYAMWTNVLKSALSGLHTMVPASNKAELDFDEVLERVLRFNKN